MVDFSQDKRGRRIVIAAGVIGIHGAIMVGASTLGTRPLATPSAPAPLFVDIVTLPPLAAPVQEDRQADSAGEPAPAAPRAPATPLPNITVPSATLPDSASGIGPTLPGGLIPDAPPEAEVDPVSPEARLALRAMLCASTGPNRPHDCDTSPKTLFAAAGSPDPFDPNASILPVPGAARFLDRPSRQPAASRYPGQQPCISPQGGTVPDAMQAEDRYYQPNAAQGGAALKSNPNEVWCD